MARPRLRSVEETIQTAAPKGAIPAFTTRDPSGHDARVSTHRYWPAIDRSDVVAEVTASGIAAGLQGGDEGEGPPLNRPVPGPTMDVQTAVAGWSRLGAQPAADMSTASTTRPPLIIGSSNVATARCSRCSSTRPWPSASYIAPARDGAQRSASTSISDHTGPSAHRTASVSSNSASARAAHYRRNSRGTIPTCPHPVGVSPGSAALTYAHCHRREHVRLPPRHVRKPVTTRCITV